MANDLSGRLQKWALDYPDEWDIVDGHKKADLETNIRIQTMLKEDGFHELAEMVGIRMLRFLAEPENE